MRNALIATVVIVLALVGLGLWSLHPRWLDSRAILHPAEWAEVKRRAAGQGFPYDVEQAKARILLAERDVMGKDWIGPDRASKRDCWELFTTVRSWSVCPGLGGRTREVQVEMKPFVPDRPTVKDPGPLARAAIRVLVWVTAPQATEAEVQSVMDRAGRHDFGPAMVVGTARLRGFHWVWDQLVIEAMPAATPLPDDWIYRPSPPPDRPRVQL